MADANIDPEIVAWLKAGYRYVSAPGAAGSWTDLGVESEGNSPLALKADAQAEAERQAAFLKGPLVRDRHRIAGSRRDLLGRCVPIKIAALGYDVAVPAFVIGIEELPSEETMLTVLRRL